jgi:hypothetical protein
MQVKDIRVATKTKTVAKLRKEALTLLQKLVRLKASDDNGYCRCVCCGCVKQWNDGMQGGHFVSRSKNQWALVEENVHPQCAGCNYSMGFGNSHKQYTLYMIDMYGREFVEEMISTNNVVKFTRIELQDMIDDFKLQIKENLERIAKLH